ncbi:ferrochelatase [Arthrobacter citreus]|nr:ferrochelatase [Arthrobacter citreus]
MKEKIGLLVMAYGTPYKESDIERYYTDIRRGRKPSPEALEELTERYRAIGGISPLAKTTVEQAKALEEDLNKIQDKVEFKMYIGLKHIEPFIEDAVDEMKKDGITKAVSIVLAPHYSTFSVKSYNERATNHSEKVDGPEIIHVDDWYKEERFIQYWVREVEKVLEPMNEEQRVKTAFIFSAHSLPEKILTYGDPYPEQLKQTAELVVEQSDIRHYFLGWQSAGNTPEPWLGPDVQDLTRELNDNYDFDTYVYLPLGFVSEHLEVLYDNDIECKLVTDEIQKAYVRPPMPNTDPLFISGLSTVVLRKLNEQ